MTPPQVQESQIVYSGFFQVRQDLLRRSDGLMHPYTSVVLSTDAAAILGQDREGRWILNREYRHPIGAQILGCPGGRLEPGEDPIEGGLREFFEETGYWSDEIELLGVAYPFAGICNQKIYFLLAKNAYKKADPSLDPFEFIQTELLTEEQLRKQISDPHSLIDGILCSALWYKELKKR